MESIYAKRHHYESSQATSWIVAKEHEALRWAHSIPIISLFLAIIEAACALIAKAIGLRIQRPISYENALSESPFKKLPKEVTSLIFHHVANPSKTSPVCHLWQSVEQSEGIFWRNVKRTSNNFR